MAYTEQITFLLFLKMADEQSKPPYNKKIVPKGLDWASLLQRDGEELERHYRHILDELGKKSGMLGAIFKKARQDIQNPATLRRLIVELIDTENWSSMQADTKGDIYEGLLEKSARESPKGAGQYFTPRELIKAIVDCVEPTPDDTVCDPACGTGGFLLEAIDFVIENYDMDKDQKRHLKSGFVRGWELVPNTARLCVMNLFLHGVDGDPCPIEAGADSLAGDPGERFSLILANPPFGDLEKESTGYERQDFWTSTKNKQLNFVQHIKTLMEVGGRCAIVVPDNVLFEGGAGETVRTNLLKQCDVHTLLRLPTGIFYAQGVKANVLFFENKPAQEKPWTKKLWVYDLRTNMHFTLKTNPLKRADLDEFVKLYKPEEPRAKRRSNWSEDKKPDGRWRSFDYDKIIKRDKANLDIFWLKDDSLEDSENLPDPGILAQEIADDTRSRSKTSPLGAKIETKKCG
ncbi:UNVERIFIED_CONTAM: hypothetical protein GTU68_059864 [Idotea baltica]|nr:hypothetical protein [Idotea baltica]